MTGLHPDLEGDLYDAIEDSLGVEQVDALTAQLGGSDSWQIADEGAADFAMRKIKRAQQSINDTFALAQKERDVIAAWEERRNSRAVHDIDFFTAKIREYHESLLAENPRAKTLDLPGGQSKIREGSVVLEVENEQTAIDWLEKHVKPWELPVRYLAELAKSEVKAQFGSKVGKEPGDYPLVTEDGEVIPGAKIRRNAPSHKIVVAE